MSAALLRALRARIREDIPLAPHLGARVVGRQGGDLVLSAPLKPNRNHKGTAFAGSLNALATLAGWGTVWLLTRERGLEAHVVIQDSTVHYDRPVRGAFEARCVHPSAAAADRLVEMVGRRGRGRIELDVAVSDAQGPAVRFRGRYVVIG